MFKILVAERFVCLKRYMVIYIEDIKIENIDISNDKQCKKHCRLKFKVYKVRLIFLIKNIFYF